MPQETQPIMACLQHIRRRLWLMRLAESVTTSLLLACIAALFILGSRLLVERYLILGLLVAIAPLACGGWLLATRRNWLGAFPRTLQILAALVLVAHFVLLFFQMYLNLALWVAPVSAGALLALAAMILTRQISPRQAAIFVDLQAGLKEKVSTALEWSSAEPASELEAAFRAPLLASAIEACAQVRSAKVGYARMNRRMYGLTLIALLCIFGMTLLEPLPALAKRNDKPNAHVIKLAAKLSDKIAEIEKKQPENIKPETTQIESLKATITELKRGNMSNLEAMSRLAEAREKMQENQDRQNASEQVKEALDSTPPTQPLAGAAEQMRDAMMKKAAGDQASGEALQKAQKALDDAAKNAADKLASGKMTDQEKKQLGDALNKAAGAAGHDPKLKQSLEDAGQALRENNSDKLSKALSDAGQQMGQQMSERKLSGEALSEAIRAADGASRDLGNNDGQNGEGQQASAGGDQGQSGGQDGQNGQQGQQNQQAGATGGEQNGGGQGESGQGSAQPGGQDGQGSGQSQMASGGGSGASQGSGSTNWENRGGPGEENPGGAVGGQGKFVKIYGENTIANRGSAEKAAGKVDSRGRSAGDKDTLSLADKNQTTITEFAGQLPSARKEAEEQLSRQQIPSQYRDLIRKYYEK